MHARTYQAAEMAVHVDFTDGEAILVDSSFEDRCSDKCSVQTLHYCRCARMLLCRTCVWF